jgi:hypothetical protein
LPARVPDLAVRSDVSHAITDSAPAPGVPAVSQALESRHNDPDVRIRRQVRKTLAQGPKAARLFPPSPARYGERPRRVLGRC